MNKSRVTRVSNAIASLGRDGIIAFDRHEPEYQSFTTLRNQTIGTAPHRALLGICAETADYQLAGNAQTFWRKLERSTLEHGSLDTRGDVRAILDDLMEANVNSRLTSQKKHA